MNTPKVSVIVPVYKQADRLTDTIQSLVSQSYLDFEVIIVNAFNMDASLDAADALITPRIKTILFDINLGRAAALNAGIHASSGEYIAFLDANDRFHLDKLTSHLSFFENNPDIHVTISGSFNVNELGEILSMRRYTSPVRLSDMVLGFPQNLGEIVVRRKSIYDIGLFDESIDAANDVLDLKCRLIAAGYCFAGIDRSLLYHVCDDIYTYNECKNVDMVIRVLESIFRYPHCPQALRKFQDRVLGGVYLHSSCLAFFCNDTFLGQDFLRKSIRFDRSILDLQANKYLTYVILASIEDDGEPQPRFQNIFDHLPPELAWMTEHRDWAVAQGYIYRGVRAIMWGRFETGIRDLTRASDLGAEIDRAFCYTLLNWVKDYEEEFGYISADKIIKDLIHFLPMVSAPPLLRWLSSVFFVNRAFRDYDNAEYDSVFHALRKVFLSNPIYLGNRGVLSILFRSIVRKWKDKF